MKVSHLSRSVVVTSGVAALIAGGMIVARAQTQGGPYSLFQFATLTGSGNTITATRIPVVNGAGKTSYKDMTIQFDVDSDGNLLPSSGFPQLFDAPALLVSSFKAGAYIGPGSVLGGKTPVYVDGPGLTDSGATTWSLTTGAGADKCTYPGSATWYVGPIDAGPMAPRLKKAGITSTAWSYGVGSSGSSYLKTCSDGSLFPSSAWNDSGILIGVSQSGNPVTIASFTSNGSDYSSPQGQVTFRLVP